MIVRPDGEGYCLVAGFHRFAALRKLGWAEIRAEVHDVDSEGERTDRAIENITSCRRRHEVINADHDGMGTSMETCRKLRCHGDVRSS